MQITNRLGLSPVWVHAVADDYDHDTAGWRSGTGLIKPPQMVELINRYGDGLSEDVDDRIWSLFGSACHYVLAKAARQVPGSISEVRFIAMVKGKEIGLKPDLLIPSGNAWHLYDFKFPSVWSIILGEHDEWFEQTNLYSHLLSGRYELFRVDEATKTRTVQPPLDVTSASIEVALRDWSASDSKREHDYPKTKTHVIPVPMWPDTKCAQFLMERVQLHIDAENATDRNLPRCTPRDRWARPDKFAVKKVGAEKASRVFESRQEADAYIQPKKKGDYMIEYRRGENVRCDRYCSARLVCSQYQAMNPEF